MKNMRYLIVSGIFLLLYSSFLYSSDSTSVVPPDVAPASLPGYVLDTGIVDASTHTRVTTAKRCISGKPSLMLTPRYNKQPGGDYGVAQMHLYIEGGTVYDWAIRSEWKGAEPGTSWYYIQYNWVIYCL